MRINRRRNLKEWYPVYDARLNESRRYSRRRNLKEKLVLVDDDQEVRYGEVKDIVCDLINNEILDSESIACDLIQAMSEDDVIDYCKMYGIIEEIDD